MALTPLDITNKEFRVRFRGYERDAVDEFLDQIIREFEVLIRENASLKEQQELLSQRLEQYRSLEETINKTLVVAQESAEEIKTNARREADLIIQEARLQAERVLEAGQVKARQVVEENADLFRAAQVLRGQVRALLQSQLDAIDHLRDPLGETSIARSVAEPSRPVEEPSPKTEEPAEAVAVNP